MGSGADKLWKCHECGTTNTDDFEYCEKCGVVRDDWSAREAPDIIKNPSHYAGAYPFEVFEARALLLDTYCIVGETEDGLYICNMKPSAMSLLNEELKYRLRAGLKEGAPAEVDIKKALRVREMRDGFEEE